MIAALLIVNSLHATTALAARKPQVLLIIGNGSERNDPDNVFPNWYHEFHTELIAGILDDVAEVTATDDLSVLNDGDLERYDMILNHSLFQSPTTEQFDAFFRFVESGKPYMTVHSGLVSFLNSDRYSRLVGGRYAGGDALGEIVVEPYDAQWDFVPSRRDRHPITRGIKPFTTVDELYMVQTNTDDIEVIARANHHPVMWLRQWGDGRVLCLTLGHDPAALKNEGFQKLFVNGVRWLLGYPIVETIPDKQFLVDTAPVNYIDLDEISSHPENKPLEYVVLSNSNPGLVKAAIDKENRVNLRFVERQSGRATIKVQAKDRNDLSDVSEFTLSVVEEGGGNLALYPGVSVYASSNQQDTNEAAVMPGKAVDDDLETRWSSGFEDPSWIYLDLGRPFSVNNVKLTWERAYGKEYEIQVSNDGKAWTGVFDEKDGDGGVDDIRFDPVTARYVRMYGRRRATEWGYSIYEFEVYGNAGE